MSYVVPYQKQTHTKYNLYLGSIGAKPFGETKAQLRLESMGMGQRFGRP